MTVAQFSPQKESTSLPELCETLVTLLSNGKPFTVQLKYEIEHGSWDQPTINWNALRQNTDLQRIQKLIQKICPIRNPPHGTERPIEYHRRIGLLGETLFLVFDVEIVRTRYQRIFRIPVPTLRRDGLCNYTSTT
jgi:hypothetical protein